MSNRFIEQFYPDRLFVSAQSRLIGGREYAPGEVVDPNALDWGQKQMMYRSWMLDYAPEGATFVPLSGDGPESESELEDVPPVPLGAPATEDPTVGDDESATTAPDAPPAAGATARKKKR